MGNKNSARRAQANGDGTGPTQAANGDAADSGTMKKSKSTNNAKSSGTASVSNSKKMISCPDLTAGAVPYRDNSRQTANGLSPSSPLGSTGGGPRQMEIKIYRSYTNVAEAPRRPELRPDIRSDFI